MEGSRTRQCHRGMLGNRFDPGDPFQRQPTNKLLRHQGDLARV